VFPQTPGGRVRALGLRAIRLRLAVALAKGRYEALITPFGKKNPYSPFR